MNSPPSPSLLRKEGAQDTVGQEHSPSLRSREGEKKGVSSYRLGAGGAKLGWRVKFRQGGKFGEGLKIIE